MTKADDKVDAAVTAARVKAGQVIDDVADLATRAAAKAGAQVHAAGEKVRDAGEKLGAASDTVKDASEKLVKNAGAKVKHAGERILKLAE